MVWYLPPPLPTCNGHTYDFFIIKRCIAHAVKGVQRVQDGGLNPHWVSRLLVRGDARRKAVRVLVRPPRVPGVLPAGPLGRHPDYEQVRKALDADDLQGAMVRFYELAREEWSDLAGTDLRFVEPSFRWVQPAGLKAQPWDGATTLSVAWRTAPIVASVTAALRAAPILST